jgi:HNH endonuclease
MDFTCPHCNETTPHTIEKYCPRCDKTLIHTAFHKNKGLTRGLAPYCKTCRSTYRVGERERLSQRMAADPELAEKEHARARRSTARWTAANPDRARANSAAYHAANPDKINKRRRQRYAENPSKPLANNKRRKARIRGATQNDLTAAQWQTIKEHFGHRCAYCGRKMARLTQDHITPVSQGGAHTLQNVVPACVTCNAKKRTGPPPKPVQPLLL